MMMFMRIVRTKVRSDSLLPDGRALRTIQAPHHVTEEEGGFRISSAAFKAGTDGTCSVDLEQLMHADGLASDALYPGLRGSVGLYAVRVDKVRTEGLGIEHDPLNANWYHGIINGDGLRRKASKRLAQACVPVVDLDQHAAAVAASTSRIS